MGSGAHVRVAATVVEAMRRVEVAAVAEVWWWQRW